MDIIERIVKMDRAAAQRVEKTLELESSRLKEQDEAAQRKSLTAVEAERKATEDYIREGQQKLDETLRKSQETRSSRCKALDDVFAAHREQWKSEILGRITGG